MAKVTFKELCENCYVVDGCYCCQYRNFCMYKTVRNQPFKNFIKDNRKKIEECASKEKVYFAGDISTLIPQEFCKYEGIGIGEFMLSEEIGKMEIEYETDND